MSEDKKPLLVVSSKVKAYAKASGISVGAEVMIALTAKVEQMIDQAIAKAKEDGRKTVKTRDVE